VVRAAEHLRYLVLAVQRAGNRALAAELRPLGLTPSQAEVLRVLRDHQPLTLTGLGELLICEHGTNPSRLVDRLVGADLVRRDTAAGDRRQVTLALTDTGEQLAARVLEVEERLYRSLEELTAGRPVEQAVDVLRALADAFPIGDAVQRRFPNPGPPNSTPNG
jgi:MarR family transcriptional regulator, organic hydroperoxide resistance regulator